MAHIRIALVNKAIQKKYPLIELVKGEGYYYVHSSNDYMALKLATLYTTSISVPNLNQMGLDRWVANVERILRDEEQPNKLLRCPII